MSREREKLIRETIEGLLAILFWVARIAAIALLVRYVYLQNKPPVELRPNDWDLPVTVTQVK